MATYNRFPATGTTANWTWGRARTDFFVSTTGNDTTGDGSYSNPYATATKAIAVSTAASLLATRDVTINYLPGTYNLTSTVTVADTDTGVGTLTIQPLNGTVNTVTLRGGAPVTGWVLHSGSIYKANIGAGLTVTTLYENGVRATKARTPKLNPGASFPMSKAPYKSTEGVDASTTVAQYSVGDFSPAAWSLTDAQMVIWSAAAATPTDWFTDTDPISSVNTGTRRFTLNRAVRYTTFTTAAGTSRFFIQGVLDLLTEAGEFHYDSTAGFLYYWPRTAPIASQTIILPTLTKVFSLAGSSTSNLAKNVVINGFNIECTQFTNDFAPAWRDINGSGQGHTYPDYDRAINQTANRLGAITMTNTTGCNIQNNHLSNTGYSGLFMLFYNKNATITKNWIEHCGHSAIYLEGTYPSEGDYLRDNTISDCRLNNFGELVGSGAGIMSQNAGHNTISNLDIYNGPRNGMFFGAYPDLPQADVYNYGNTISYVRIRNVCQDSGDCGALGISGISDDLAYLFHTFNQIWIDGANAHSSMLDAAPNGIFTDNDSYGQHFSNCKTQNTQGAGQRDNDSGSHVTSNVSWTGVYDATLMASPVGNAAGVIGTTTGFPFA